MQAVIPKAAILPMRLPISSGCTENTADSINRLSADRP